MLRFLFSFMLVHIICAKWIPSPCPSGTFQGTKAGDCFQFNNKKAPWGGDGGALGKCGEYCPDDNVKQKDYTSCQASLASIQHAFENTLVTKELKKLTNNTSQKVWLGGYVEEDCNQETGQCECNWNWSDSSDFYYQNWDTNGWDGLMDTSKAVAIDSEKGTWFAINETTTLAYLCKIVIGNYTDTMF